MNSGVQSGDQIYKDACDLYKAGKLEEAAKLFYKAIDYFFRSQENEKEAKAHYYRGCTYYRLGVQCEKNEMFQESKKNLDISSTHFKISLTLINNIINKIDKETKNENKNHIGNQNCQEIDNHQSDAEKTHDEGTKSCWDKYLERFELLLDESTQKPNLWHYNKGIVHLNLARTSIKLREYEKSDTQYLNSIKAFSKFINSNTDFALPYYNKGSAYLELKQYNKAIKHFQQAFEKDEVCYLAKYNEGNALYFLGKYYEAINAYKEIEKIEEKCGTEKISNILLYKSYNNKGLALCKLGKYGEAIEAFEEAKKINSGSPEAWTNIGIVFYKLDMLSEAKKAFEESLKKEQSNALASNNLGVVLANEGELDRAKKLFENTVQEKPDFILGHANLSELLLNSGAVKEAYEKIKEFVEDESNPDPNMGYINFLNGRIKIEDIEIKEKKYSEAAKSFEKAVSYNVEKPEYLLWSVYAKYLCQKFEITGTTNSSEESQLGKENVLQKAEGTCSKEFSNSIISDLHKVLNFCNTSAIKKSSLPRLLNQNLLWEIVITIIISYMLFYLFEILEFDIGNLSNIQPNYLDLIAIGLIGSVLLFGSKLTWPLIAVLAMILLFGPYTFNRLILSFTLLISMLLIILLKLLDQRSIQLKASIIIPTIVITTIVLFWPFLFALPFAFLFAYIMSVVLAVRIMILKLFRLTDGSLQIQVKVREYLIKFNKHKEIKAYTLYLLGYFYFKLQDYTTAKEKLQECLNLRPDARTDKAASELLDGIWKHKIKPPFWIYWFNSPVKTWRRRAFGTLITILILSILFVHLENPQPIALNGSTSNNIESFIPDQINFYPYIISYPLSNTSSGSQDRDNVNNITSTWNILTPALVNIYPDIPNNYFDAILLLILILILISPSVRIVENVKLIFKKGADVSLDLGPIAAPPEFNFELSPSLMQDVIRRLDENL